MKKPRLLTILMRLYSFEWIYLSIGYVRYILFRFKNYLIQSDKTRRLETTAAATTLPPLESATLKTGEKYQSSIGKVTIIKTYFVYILRSTKNGKFFIGLTEDLYECFERHNSGRNPQTTNLFPFELIYYEPFINYFDAKNREKYFRSETGNRFLKKHLHHYFSSKKTNSVGKILKVASFISVQILLILLPTLLVLLKIPEGSQAAWYSSGWSKRKKLTIDNTKVSGSSDLTNFSILVSITDTDLKNYAQSDADDILFTSQDGTTKLNHEIEKYTSTTGVLVAWVQIPTLYTATDTIIYMYYGNSGASSQQSIAATWDSNYAAVYHFAQDPSGGGAKELNSENNTIQGTPAGTWSSSDLVTGKIGDALNFDRAQSDRVTLTDNHSGNNITVSGWINGTSYASGNWNTLAQRTDTGSWFDWQFYPNDGAADGLVTGDVADVPKFKIDANNDDQVDNNESVRGTAALSTSTWYFITATYDGSALRYYQDGSLINSKTCTSCTITDSSNDIWVGGNSVWGEYFDGKIDEFRVSTTYRSTDWITTEYNNQNSPSTFFTTGSQESQANSSTETPIMYWALDEGNGTTVNDRSGNSNSGTITNAVWKTEDLCVVGKCLFFDGTGDYVSRAVDPDFDFAASDSFSITGWFRHKVSSSGTDMILARHNSTAGGFKLYMESDGDITCGIDRDSTFSPEDSATSTAATYDDNQWHHVACIKSTTSSLTLYIDGIQVAQDASIASTGSYANANTLYLGIDGDGSSNGFEGFLDDFKIYRAALSSSQLKADMNNKGAVRGAAAQMGQADTSFLNDGLVGYWNMDETSAWATDCSTSSILDISGNGNNGKPCPNASAVIQNVSKFNKGAGFDGTNDYISIPSSSTTDNLVDGKMTISAWIYTTAAATTQRIWTKRNNYIQIYNFSGNKIRASIFNSADNISGTTLDTNTWYHLAITYDDNGDRKAKIYINGVEDSYSAISNADGIVQDDSSFATEISTSSTPFVGNIDDFRIYNRSLSPVEIRQLYNWAPGPIGYWKLDENTGTSSVFDSSGNGNTGTLTAAVASDWVIGKYGPAFNFDTTRKSKISLGTSSLFADMNTLTAGVWLFPRTTGDNNEGRFFDKTSSTGPTAGWYFKFRNSAQQLNFAVDYNTVDLSINSADAIPLNAWSYVTATWDGNADPSGGHVHIYINGVETSSYSGAATGTGGRVADSTSQLKLGNYEGTSNYRTFDGYMDDAKLYNYIRTPQQIVEDMNGSHPIGGSPVGSQLLYTKLDEQNGNTINNSGSGTSTYNGTNSGAAWLTSTSCKTNGCLNFDTTTDNVTFNDVSFVDSIASMSATFWLNPQTLQTTKSIVSKIKTSAASNSFAIVTDSTNSDEIRVYIASSTSDTSNYFLTSNLDLVNSSWQHVEVIYDGTLPAANRVTVYKNGRAVSGSVTGTIPNTMTSGSTAELRLGDDQGSTYTTLLTYIDEFKLYTSALTQDQVLIDYNQGSSVNFGVGAPTPEPAQMSDGAGNAPVGYWNFDENSGQSAFDRSGNNNTGTLGTNTSQEASDPIWSIGKTSAGLKFDGSNTKVDVADNVVLDIGNGTNLTISAWVRRLGDANFNNPQSIVSKRNSGGSGAGYELMIASSLTGCNYASTSQNSVCLNVSDGTDTYSIQTSAAVITADSVWHHIEAVFDDSTAANNVIYIDGIPQSVTLTGTLANVDSLSNAVDLCIGKHISGSSCDTGTLNNMNGYIDEVRIYNYARSQAQIAYDFNRGAPTGWWKFDECTGGTAYDAGSQQNNGALGGTSGSNTSNGSCGTTDTATKWYNGINGKFNASLDFDGTDDNVSLGDLSYSEGISQLTWSVWVKPATLSVSKGILAKANSNTTQTSWGVGTTSIDSNEPDCFISTNTTDLSTAGYTTTNVLSVGTWTHITCVFDGTQADNPTRLKMYIDGKLQNLTFAGTIPATTQATTSNVLVGAASDNALNFDGQIDDVRVYNYSLSATQVQKIYNDGSSVFFGPATGSP